MSLLVVPGWIWVMVRTPGSNVVTRRVTIDWSACTISHAAGTGSSVRNGSLACPPFPVRVMLMVSLEAMSGPRRVQMKPVGAFDVV